MNDFNKIPTICSVMNVVQITYDLTIFFLQCRSSCISDMAVDETNSILIVADTQGMFDITMMSLLKMSMYVCTIKIIIMML